MPFLDILSEHFPQQRKKMKTGKQIPQSPEDYPYNVPSTTQQGIVFFPDFAIEPVSS